jgi:type I restriction enzyme, S subunit
MRGLPHGWVMATLQDVASWSSGGTPKTGTAAYYGGDIPWAVIGDLNDARVVKTAASISAAGLAKSSAKVVPANTTLIAMYGASIGKLGIAALPMATNQAIACAEPFAGLASRWLFWWLRACRQDLRDAGKGGAQPNISQGVLRSWPIPIAPSAEQERIVTAIEEAFSKLDAGEAALRVTRQRLKRLRESVLAAAVTGRLVPQDPTAEPASKLLASLYAGALGVTGHLRKDDPFGQAELVAIPDSWSWERSATVCATIACGGTPTADRMTAGNGDVPFIKVYNLTLAGVLDFSVDPTYIDADSHSRQSRSAAVPGDVLTNIVGPPLGKVAVIPDTHDEWNMNQAVVLFRPGPTLAAGYLALALRARPVAELLSGTARATAGQFNVSLTACRYLPLPVPPLAEQHRIVAEAERQFSFIDACERTIDVGLAGSAALRRSILKSAFEGKLVLQDPTDESAAELLRRIAEARPVGGSGRTQKVRQTRVRL